MKGIIVDVERLNETQEIVYVCYEKLGFKGATNNRVIKRIRNINRRMGRPRGKNLRCVRRDEIVKTMRGLTMEQLEQVAGLIAQIKESQE